MTDTTTADAARDAAHDTAREAAERSRDVARTTAEQGKQVASSAADQARDVVDLASQQVSTVGGQAMDQARTVMDSTAVEVRDQLDGRLRDLSAQARDIQGEIEALLDGRPEDAGRTADLARSASEHIGRLADRADELGVQGVVEEVSDLARRRPLLFLAGAATAGLVVGRMARAGKEVQSSGGSDSSGAADAITPGWGEGGAPMSVPPGTSAATLPPPAPLPSPAVPGTDPGGSAWAGA